MEIVIKIPEEEYKLCKRQVADGITNPLKIYIANGTPLPKGHGKLIDGDGLIKTIGEKAKRLSNTDTINGLCGAVALIFDAPTIIEADKAEKEKKYDEY